MITRCLERANMSFCWPGISRDSQSKVSNGGFAKKIYYLVRERNYLLPRLSQKEPGRRLVQTCVNTKESSSFRSSTTVQDFQKQLPCPVPLAMLRSSRTCWPNGEYQTKLWVTIDLYLPPTSCTSLATTTSVTLNILPLSLIVHKQMEKQKVDFA